jgi:hypothetical protein
LVAVVALTACGGVAPRHQSTVRSAVPATGPGFPIERAEPSPQDLRILGPLAAHVTQARAVCVQLAPPPEAEFVAQLLLELNQGRYLLLLSVRPYAGPGTYEDNGVRPPTGQPVATIALSGWRTPPTDPPARPTRPSSFSVDASGLAGTLNAQGIAVALGKTSISGAWNCLPLR